MLPKGRLHIEKKIVKWLSATATNFYSRSLAFFSESTEAPYVQFLCFSLLFGQKKKKRRFLIMPFLIYKRVSHLVMKKLTGEEFKKLS